MESVKLLSKEEDLKRMRHLIHDLGIYQKSKLASAGIRHSTLKSHYRSELSVYMCPPISLDQKPIIVGVTRKGRIIYRSNIHPINRDSWKKLDDAIRAREEAIPLTAKVSVDGMQLMDIQLTGMAKRLVRVIQESHRE